jgi:hypothetical protein
MDECNLVVGPLSLLQSFEYEDKTIVVTASRGLRDVCLANEQKQ